MKALLIQIRTICARLSKQKGLSVVLTSVVLQTSAKNLVALKFYEVCGYQRQALKAGYYGVVRFSFSRQCLLEGERCYSNATSVGGRCWKE